MYNRDHDSTKKLKQILAGYILLAFFITECSCTKLVTVEPPVTSLTSGNIYTDDATAAAVLTGMYIQLGNNSPLFTQNINCISLVCGLSADELTLYGGSANGNANLVQYYLNRLVAGSSSNAPSNIWTDSYSKIYTLNIALENLAISNSLTPAVKKQLIGEAKFMRAFFYFYLVNLYGPLPLPTTSDYQSNALLKRAVTSEVYRQIIADLSDAQNLLSDSYMAADAMTWTSERVRPNKWAATALLARAFLYDNIYDSAELEATAVINNSTVYNLVTLNNVFLKNSLETIWQLQPVIVGWNTFDAQIFILPPTGPTSSLSSSGFPVYLSPQLLSSFENNDQRRLDWVDSVVVNNVTYYFPYKYKNATLNASQTEYTMVLRLGEQFLIRAEARANGNNISGAQDDLNTIRARAGLSNTSANDRTSLLAAIEHERRTELFTEWGNRWLDLKRTGTVDQVMNAVAPAKGTTWSAEWQLYPLSLYDLTQDPNLIQNLGY